MRVTKHIREEEEVEREGAESHLSFASTTFSRDNHALVESVCEQGAVGVFGQSKYVRGELIHVSIARAREER